MKKSVYGYIVALLCACMVLFCTAGVVKASGEADTDWAIGQEDFLKAKGQNLRNQSGKGEVVNLRGTNAGGYLLQECWLTPTAETNDVRAESDIYRILEIR